MADRDFRNWSCQMPFHFNGQKCLKPNKIHPEGSSSGQTPELILSTFWTSYHQRPPCSSYQSQEAAVHIRPPTETPPGAGLPLAAPLCSHVAVKVPNVLQLPVVGNSAPLSGSNSQYKLWGQISRLRSWLHHLLAV